MIGRVLDGPARVLVDGATWHGYAGWQSLVTMGPRSGPRRAMDVRVTR